MSARSLSILGWLNGYDRAWLRADALAGVSTWALVIPQAVAYGGIAGLSPQAGLAAAFAGPLSYAVLGTSRQLIVSPTSSTAAISAALAGPLAHGDAAHFAALSALLALLTGVIFVVLGVLKLGFVSQFLAVSVQVGFMFGLGLTIAVGQLFKLLGVPPPPSGTDFLPSVWQLVISVNQINAWTAALGVGCLGALLLLRRLVPLAPAALLVIVAATAITGLLGLDQRGVSTVGAIPGGLPAPAVPDVSLSEVLTLLPVSLALAVIGYAESASVAQDFATHRKYTISPDRELIALGGANVLSGFLQAFMVAGGASQSAANDRAGARSQVASLVVAVLALLTALFLTPLFFYLPNAALAAIVISAVLGFFRASELARIRQLRRDSFAIALIALGGVLLLGMLPGLLLAILISILIVLTRIARPTVSELGLIPNQRTFVDLDSDPEAAPLPGVLTLRPNALLLFMNARWVRSLVLVRATESSEQTRPRAVLLDLGMSSNLDIEDVDTLAELRSSLRDEGVHLWLGNVRPRARAALERSGYVTDAPGLVQPELQTYVELAREQQASENPSAGDPPNTPPTHRRPSPDVQAESV